MSTAALPTEWTQVKRDCDQRLKRERRMDDLLNRQPLASAENPSIVANRMRLDNKNKSKMVTLAGRAILCLHDIDCEWWQGHFLRRSNESSNDSSDSNSLGLLCTLRQMGECMVCSDGGYRELDTKIIRFQNLKSLSIPCMSTGGDMLRIRSDIKVHNNNIVSSTNDIATTNNIDDGTMVAFDADTVLTGNDAIPYLRKFFKRLLRTKFSAIFVVFSIKAVLIVINQ